MLLFLRRFIVLEKCVWIFCNLKFVLFVSMTHVTHFFIARLSHRQIILVSISLISLSCGICILLCLLGKFFFFFSFFYTSLCEDFFFFEMRCTFWLVCQCLQYLSEHYSFGTHEHIYNKPEHVVRLTILSDYNHPGMRGRERGIV